MAKHTAPADPINLVRMQDGKVLLGAPSDEAAKLIAAGTHRAATDADVAITGYLAEPWETAQ